MIDRRQHEVLRLAYAQLDGQASAAQIARLESLLLADGEAGEVYIEFMELAAGLCWQRSANRHEVLMEENLSRQAWAQAIAAGDLATPGGLAAVSVKSPSFWQTWDRRVLWSIAGCAAVFVVYFAAISWDMLRFRHRENVATSGGHAENQKSEIRNQQSEAAPVATIRDSVDAQWSRSTNKLEISNQKSEISPGEPLAIDSGLVELQLTQGVTLLIEGPAKWSIDGDNNATLKRGKLVAKVPERAIGFTLETPNAKIVDLGTEFGVQVDPDRGASVRVVKGRIDVRPTSIGHPSAKSLRLSANQAVRVSSDGVTEPIEPDTLKFAEAISPPGRSDASDPGYEVVLYYRMGEDDPADPDDDGNAEVLRTHPHASASVQRPLKLMPSAFHIDGVAPNFSQRAIRFERRGATPQWEMLGVPADIKNWLLEAWVRVDAISNVQLAHVGDANTGYGLVFWDGKLHGVFEGESWFDPTSQPELGKWTHLALLHEYGFTQLFVNGRPEGDTRKIDPPSHGGQFAIGVGESFRGAIDEVRLVKLKRAFEDDMLLWKATHPVTKPANKQGR